jgi:hypothetical protein
MGYTHYWNIPRLPSDRRWNRFVDEARQILAYPSIAPLVCLEFDQPDTPPLVSASEVRFNGKGEDGYETLLIGRKAGFAFCKTARKPYDLAVCCVLLAAERCLLARVTSDGDRDGEEWAAAREFKP